jgi:uncharacterized protein (DUF305 family)
MTSFEQRFIDMMVLHRMGAQEAEIAQIRGWLAAWD